MGSNLMKTFYQPEYETDYDNPCPHCGHDEIRWRHCEVVGCDDGWIDMHEYDDPLWFDEGETEICPECRGTGIEQWCPKCGKDPREKPNVSTHNSALSEWDAAQKGQGDE